MPCCGRTNFDADGLDARLFSYSSATDEQIAMMFEPLVISTLPLEQREQHVQQIMAHIKKTRERAEQMLKEQKAQHAAENAEKDAAQARFYELTVGYSYKTRDLRKIAEKHGLKLTAGTREENLELRRRMGSFSANPNKHELAVYIVDVEFPGVSFPEMCRIPHGWREERRDGAHLSRPYSVYHGE